MFNQQRPATRRALDKLAELGFDFVRTLEDRGNQIFELWRGPGGKTIILHQLPGGGYQLYSCLAPDTTSHERTMDKLEKLVNESLVRSEGGDG